MTPKKDWFLNGVGMSAMGQKRTFGESAHKSAKCHVWTAPGWQVKTSRCVAGRCSHVFGLLARFA